MIEIEPRRAEVAGLLHGGRRLIERRLITRQIVIDELAPLDVAGFHRRDALARAGRVSHPLRQLAEQLVAVAGVVG
jgi:hypothetical protein